MSTIARGRIESGNILLDVVIKHGKGVKIIHNSKDHICLSIGEDAIKDDLTDDKYYGLIYDHILPLIPLDVNSEAILNQYKIKILRKIILEEIKLFLAENRLLARRALFSPYYFLLNHYRRKALLFVFLRQYFKFLARESLENIPYDVLNTTISLLIADGYLKRPYYDDKVGLGNRSLGIKSSPIDMLLNTVPYLSLLNLRVDIKSILKIISLLTTRISISDDLDLGEKVSQYAFLETDKGLSSLTIDLPFSIPYKQKIRLGGIINTAYLIEDENRGTYVLKKYHEWSGLKWLPIALWSLGAYYFDTSAKRRLLNEYSMNRDLKDLGFKVPGIYYVNLRDKFVVEEYVQGSLFRDVIIEGLTRGKMLDIIEIVLSEIAKVHKCGIVLGDANPTNIIVNNDQQDVFFIDLEQAKYSNKSSWDLAILFFFTAHYVRSLKLDNLRSVLEAIVRGYLKYGDIRPLKEALSPSYIRVFTLFAFPHALIKTYIDLRRMLIDLSKGSSTSI